MRRHPPAVDYTSEVAQIWSRFPVICGADGMPMTWAQFMVANREISRILAQGSLQQADAVRAAFQSKEERAPWLAAQRAAAGIE